MSDNPIGYCSVEMSLREIRDAFYLPVLGPRDGHQLSVMERTLDAIKAGRLFWFNDVGDFGADERLYSLMKRGTTLWREGLIDHPFQEPYVVACKSSITHTTNVVTFARTTRGADIQAQFDVIDGLEHNITQERGLFLVGSYMVVPPQTAGDALMWKCLGQPEWVDGATMKETGILGAALMGLTLCVLNTDGVPRHVDTPSTKLNKKRVSRGRYPLAAVTHIDAAAYITAAKNTGGGTHASPAPHIRRGHRRHLTDGRVVWVRDCLVNVKHGAPIRTHYEVRV